MKRLALIMTILASPALALDPEIEAQIARELAERNAAYEDGQP